MALKINVAANYLSQIYNGLIAIIVMPFYLKFLGAEAYGLIAFFMLLQSWFFLLDIGLSQTLSRETVKLNNNALNIAVYNKLYNYINIIFLSLAFFLVFTLSVFKLEIASSWLKVNDLNVKDVLISLQIMFLCAGLRCMGGIYRGIIQGFERILWMSFFNIIINTLRFVLVIPILFYFGFNIKNYFYFQLVVAVFEFLTLFIYHRYLILEVKKKEVLVKYNEVGEGYFSLILKFAVLSGINSILWVVISQGDKLLLSSILPLSDYAIYSVAIMLASIVYMISTPISNVLLPRLTALYTTNRIKDLEYVYGFFAQFITMLAAVFSFTVIWNVHEIIEVWSRGQIETNKIENILILYLLGNVFLIINGFSYYIQYAYGDIKRHFIGCIILFLVMTPLMYVISEQYGAVGAGAVWFAVHFFWFFTWTFFINKKFNSKYKELMKNLIFILISTSLGAWILSVIFDLVWIFKENLFVDILKIIVYGLIMMVIGLFSSVDLRNFILQKYRNYLS